MGAAVGDDGPRHCAHGRLDDALLELLLHVARLEEAEAAAFAVRAAVAAHRRILGEHLKIEFLN